MDLTNWLGFMTRTDGPRAVYLLRAFGATLGGTVLLAILAVLFIPSPDVAADTSPPPPFVGFVIFWPALSTGLIWGAVEVMKRFAPTYWHAAGGTMLVFAGFFAMVSGLQGAVNFAWPYFMFALTFLAWQLKSNLDAFVMTFALQAAVNLILALLLFPAPE